VEGFIVVAAFLALFLLGFPVVLAIAIPCLVYIFANGLPIDLVAQRTLYALDSFPLVAVPVFLFVGSLMTSAGISGHIYRFADTAVGRLPGGLAQVNIFGSLIFSGMSGSALADIGGLGRTRPGPPPRARGRPPARLLGLVELKEFAQRRVRGLRVRHRVAFVIRLQRPGQATKPVSRYLDAEPRAGGIERGQDVSRDEERRKAHHPILRTALQRPAAHDGSKLLPGVQEELPHRIDPRGGARGQNGEQLVATGEQQIEEIVADVATSRNAPQVLDDEDEKGIPMLECALPLLELNG